METSNVENLSLFEDLDDKNDILSPFIGRKIVIEGVFHTIKKDALKTIVLRLGGDVVSGDVTKKVNYFIKGDRVSAEKLEKYNKLSFDGYHIMTLLETDVVAILNGEGARYCVPGENVKDLHLSIEHYNKKHVVYQDIKIEPSGREYLPNPIYGKNIYLGQGITGDLKTLSQMLGLVGVFGGGGLNDSTQIIVLSHNAFDALKNGKTHPELDLIQDTYNKGLAQWYDYLLTTEEELLSWFKARIDLHKDSVCKKLFEEFIESKK